MSQIKNSLFVCPKCGDEAPLWEGSFDKPFYYNFCGAEWSVHDASTDGDEETVEEDVTPLISLRGILMFCVFLAVMAWPAFLVHREIVRNPKDAPYLIRDIMYMAGPFVVAFLVRVVLGR